MMPQSVPAAAPAAAPTSPAYLERTLDWIERTPFEALPAAVVERTRWIVADTLAVIAAGMQAPEMQALAAAMAPAGPGGDAWVVGAGRTAPPQPAAFLNGSAGTWLELDEGSLFGNGHPGIQVIPAALAYAQSRGASGRDFLRAIAFGYEIAARVGGGAKMKLWVHPHGTHGVIGAALACALLDGAPRERLRHVINIAAAMGLGTNRQAMREGATVRNAFSGHSGIAGQLVPVLAAAGFLGQSTGIDVTYTHVLADGFDPERYAIGLGERWFLAENYFKLYPAGRYVHSPIDALLDVLATVPGGRLDPATIARIEVRTFRMAAFLDVKRIDSSFGAKFSVPFALATILRHGGSSVAAFDDPAVRDPVVQALLAKVEVTEVPEFTARYPDEQVTELRIVLVDGRVVEGRCDVMRGEPSRPHEPRALHAKFMALAEPVFGHATAGRLLDDCMHLERIDDLRAHARALPLDRTTGGGQ